MTRASITADEIKRAIAGRISTGIYPAGTPLPPLRRLADDLGANRNTIQKACRMLQDLGMLEVPAGKRSLVVRAVPEAGGVVEHFRGQARTAIWEAMAAGVAREHVQLELAQLVEELYGSAEIRVRFFECNHDESTLLSQELSRLTNLPIGAGLVDDLLQDGIAIAQQHDLLVTTFHHLGEISRGLVSSAAAIEKLVGVDTRLAPETLLGIARLPNVRIGVICTLANTAQMLRHTILSYRHDRQVEIALIDSPGDIERVARECDHLIVTHNCVPIIEQLIDRPADVVVEFRIDAQSIAYLRERIGAIRRRQQPILAEHY
jgi:GntR family transcriptional regulator